MIKSNTTIDNTSSKQTETKVRGILTMCKFRYFPILLLISPIFLPTSLLYFLIFIELVKIEFVK